MGDIEALLSLIYAGPLTIKFIGRRSNQSLIVAADLRGRPLDPSDLDLNQALFTFSSPTAWACRSVALSSTARSAKRSSVSRSDRTG